MKQITLDDCLLEAMAITARDDMKALLENLEINLNERFKRSENGLQAIDLAKKIVTLNGAIYKSMKSQIGDLRKQNSRQEDQFFRIYWAYVSSEGILDMLKNGGGDSVKCAAIERIPVDFSLTLDSTDQTTLFDAANNYCQFILGSPSPEHVKPDTIKFFEVLSSYAREKMDDPFLAKYRDAYKDTVVIGKNFKVEGIKKPRRQVVNAGKQGTFDQNNNLKKLEEIALDPVKRDEIVGNLNVIGAIESDVHCLMHYDPSEKRNPFRGFRQYIMLAGKTGTGKTMLARYAMTLAKEIGAKCKKPLSLVKLNFEDHWQYGPLRNIRNQLTEISDGNRIYMVFVDEFDTKIPSRNDCAKDGYRNDVVGEFLRFRGGGDYINRGNYIIIVTTNAPKKVDPAVLSVFKIEEIAGPVTAEEKAKVLYNNLAEGVKQHYVRVNNWKAIGELLCKYDLNGRDIVSIAHDAQEKYRKIASRISHQTSATETERIIRAILSKDGSEYITTDEDIFKSIAKQVKKSEAEKKSYLPDLE